MKLNPQILKRLASTCFTICMFQPTYHNIRTSYHNIRTNKTSVKRVLDCGTLTFFFFKKNPCLYTYLLFTSNGEEGIIFRLTTIRQSA